VYTVNNTFIRIFYFLFPDATDFGTKASPSGYPARPHSYYSNGNNDWTKDAINPKSPIHPKSPGSLLTSMHSLAVLLYNITFLTIYNKIASPDRSMYYNFTVVFLFFQTSSRHPYRLPRRLSNRPIEKRGPRTIDTALVSFSQLLCDYLLKTKGFLR